MDGAGDDRRWAMAGVAVPPPLPCLQQHGGPATACGPGPTAQERLCDLGTFDAVFYDTFDEGLDAFDLFCSALPALLRPGGTFSWFNGFGGHSARAHSAASERAARLLDAIGCAISLSRARSASLSPRIAPRPCDGARRRLPADPRRRGTGSSAATSSCRSRRRRPTSGRACAGGTTRSMRTCCRPPRGLTEHLSRGRARRARAARVMYSRYKSWPRHVSRMFGAKSRPAND